MAAKAADLIAPCRVDLLSPEEIESQYRCVVKHAKDQDWVTELTFLNRPDNTGKWLVGFRTTDNSLFVVEYYRSVPGNRTFYSAVRAGGNISLTEEYDYDVLDSNDFGEILTFVNLK